VEALVRALMSRLEQLISEEADAEKVAADQPYDPTHG